MDFRTWLPAISFVATVGMLSATLVAQAWNPPSSKVRSTELINRNQTMSTAIATPIAWQSDLDVAKKQAAEQNKLVFLHFTADWCRPCDTLETFVFTNPQVQRSFATNLIALNIDVDQHPELVKEYGVAGVPFDIAITPAGRVVSKRSSPRDALVYNDMLQSFNKTIQAIAGGENRALNQNLDEFKEKMAGNQQVVQQKSFTPQTPAHQGPQPSFESSELHRNSTIANPFANSVAKATANATLIIPQVAAAGNGINAGLARGDQELSEAMITNPNAVQPKRILNKRFFEEEVVEETRSTASTTARVDHPDIDNDERIQSLNPDSLDNVAAQINQKKPAKKVVNLLGQFDPAKYALHGKCPVTLLKEGRWEDGDQQWGCTHRQRIYLFSSAANLAEFQRDPDAWSPLLSGHDPVVFERTGELVEGVEAHGVFMGKIPNQRVVLFHSPETRAEFQENPHKYIETIRQAMQSSGGSSSTIIR